MTRALLGGEDRVGFCALRPSGHHAEPGRAMGFCLFDNVAIAAELAIRELGAERVLVFDWDVHHGNGTAEAFRSRSDVLFISIHQAGIYPGSGPSSDFGSGEGEGYTINLPVPAGADEELWLSLLEHIVLPVATSFDPDLVLVSAGFDAHRADPLADCLLEAASFAQMACHVRDLAARLEAPLGVVLEGGYEPAALADSVVATLAALGGEGEAIESAPEPLLTSRAAAGVARHWTSEERWPARSSPRSPPTRSIATGMLLGEDYAEVAAAAERARSVFAGRTVWNVSSTLSGGGVAEMLRALLPYVRGAGVDARWVVLREQPEFFELTKRLHNNLHGDPGDGGELGESERELYESALTDSARHLAPLLDEDDIVLLHDPQTAGLVPAAKETGADGHLALSHRRRRSERGDPSGLELPRPLRDRRRRLRLLAAELRLGRARSRPGRGDAALDRPALAEEPGARRRDGRRHHRRDRAWARTAWRRSTPSPAPTAPRRASSAAPRSSRTTAPRRARGRRPGLALGPAQGPPRPARVLRAPPRRRGPPSRPRRPATAAVSDDPEGAAVWREVQDAWHDLPAEVRRRAHLVSLPMDDTDENAAMVNALQRRAEIVVQKSLAEGFGLTVAEAMWKRRPVIGTRVGGIQDQIVDGESGLLIDDPRDLEALAEAIRSRRRPGRADGERRRRAAGR